MLPYTWNDIDNLSSISDGTNTIASDAWIGVRRKTETFQSGARRTNWYTGFREEIESVRHETSGSSTILRLDYGYNAVHDRTYERYGSSGSPGDAFEYDKLRRLTVAWMGSTTPSSPSGNPYTTKIQYNYDDDGNRTSVVTTPWQQPPQTTSYSTNNLNEYTSVGGTTQVSDANGNLTDNGTYLFLYDYKNHIVQVKLKSSGSVAASYRYDALGRRVEKNVGGTVERHVLSIWKKPGVVRDLSHVVTVYDGSDNWRQNFVWSDEVDGIQMLEQKDVLDYDTDGNTTEVTRSFYHRNALGSVMEITDMNQAVVVSYRYDPYGKVTITRAGTPQSSDPLGSHWTFTGRFLDEEAGLLHYRARYYDPATGRFLQRDPLGYAEGPNLFAYVWNSPQNVSDPSGLDAPVPLPWWVLTEKGLGVAGSSWAGPALATAGVAAAVAAVAGAALLGVVYGVSELTKPKAQSEPQKKDDDYVTTGVNYYACICSITCGWNDDYMEATGFDPKSVEVIDWWPEGDGPFPDTDVYVLGTCPPLYPISCQKLCRKVADEKIKAESPAMTDRWGTGTMVCDAIGRCR